MTKEIELTKDYVALIDDDDYARVSQLSWCAHKGKTKMYAGRTEDRRHLYMQNYILGDVPKGLRVDHINGDGLDNRKCNLRLCTKAQNSVNSPKIKGIMGTPTSSKYKGVCWDKKINKWSSYIRINTKKTYLGSYVSEEDAALAYNAAAFSHHGEFAVLNKVMT